MSSLESKLNLQESRIILMQNHLKPFNDSESPLLTKAEVQTRLGVLEATCTKFERDHDRICESKPEVLKDILYITEDHYSIGQEAYMVSKSTMLNYLETFTPLANSYSEQRCAPQVMLPKIPLIQFSGDYQSWKPFSDIFTSFVIKNPDLSDVAKLHYLKSCLNGEATQLVSNLQISAENFEIAWNKLVVRYENKRVLISKHLDIIFKLKPLAQKSSKGLNSLLSTMNESLSSLKALGSPTEHWDHIISYMIVNRLDPDTHESWEVHQGASVNPPTLKELEDFIEGRARALENIEGRDSARFYSPMKHSGNAPIKIKSNVTSFDKSKLKNNVCLLCNEDHYLSNCKYFYQKTPLCQKEFLVSKQLCYNCLGSHILRDCRSQKCCLKCNKRHHTMIHDVMNHALPLSKPHSQSNHSESQLSQATNESDKISTSKSVNHATPNLNTQQSAVILATAQVIVSGPKGNSITARALIDQGSEISFISERIVQTLQLKRSPGSVPLVGIGGTHTSTTRGIVNVTLSPIFDTNVTCSATPFILSKLTSTLPSMKVPHHKWTHFESLNLADPKYMNPGSIDFIIGADIYGLIILPNLVKGPPSTPIAQSTIFGWVISGPSGCATISSNAYVHHCKLDENINNLIQTFWNQEEIPKSECSYMSPENEACEEHFKSTHSRTESGRYVVKLPLKEPAENLGDSRSSALVMLNSLKKRFITNPDYHKLYSDFISEYESLNHMSKVESDSKVNDPIFYLPHHGVLRDTSSTTKLRVVFNGSQRTSSGKSLNDILHTGKKLQTDLSDVLIWFRQFKYVFSADIEKMYRQIMVHSDDWDYNGYYGTTMTSFAHISYEL